MSSKVQEKARQVETSEISLQNWDQLIVELEQSSKACTLAIDLLKQIISSLQVSVQSVQEHYLPQQELT